MPEANHAAHLSLGQDIKVLSGFAFPSEGFNQLVGLPLIRIRDLASANPEIRFKGHYDPSYLIRKGDLLIGMDGDFEVHRWTGDIALLNQRVCKVEAATQRLNQGFLYWYLQPKVAQIHRRTPQTTVRHLSASDVYLIPKPDIGTDEQAVVVKILDTLDTGIHETEAIIAKLKLIKQGLLHDLLTRGIDANGELRPHRSEAPHLYKQSPMGWIPNEWQSQELAAVALPVPNAIVDGPFGSNLKSVHYRERGVPVIQSGYVTTGEFEADRYFYISESHFRTQSRSQVLGGDIVMAKIGANAGMCAVLPSDHPMSILAGNTLKITVNPEKIERDWLVHYLHRLYQLNQMSEVRTETAQPAISLKRIRGLNIPVPTLDEQQHAIKTLQAISNGLLANQLQLDKFGKTKIGLMDDLLTGRVRVTPLLAESAQQSGSV